MNGSSDDTLRMLEKQQGNVAGMLAKRKEILAHDIPSPRSLRSPSEKSPSTPLT